LTSEHLLQPLPVQLYVLAIALMIDFGFGEPPRKIHPTVWIGRFAEFLNSKIKRGNQTFEKLCGVFLCLSILLVFVVPVYVGLALVQQHFGVGAYVLVAALLLKSTFAVKDMERHVTPIVKAVGKGDLAEARLKLQSIVGRDTSRLDRDHVASATVESIAEGIVDGAASALFFFALAGVPGALAYRVINTLDSTVGYIDREYRNVGWFSVKLDTAANYIPARLAALLIVLSALLTHGSLRNSWRILRRDRCRTRSLNAGWSMSAMAGLLNVRLEKVGFYVLGGSSDVLETKHILHALQVMKTTTLLFSVLIVIPILMVSAAW